MGITKLDQNQLNEIELSGWVICGGALYPIFERYTMYYSADYMPGYFTISELKEEVNSCSSCKLYLYET